LRSDLPCFGKAGRNFFRLAAEWIRPAGQKARRVKFSRPARRRRPARAAENRLRPAKIEK